MNGIITKIQEGLKQLGYKARTMSITHLSEVQETVGKLVRQGLLNQRLHEGWHFYLQTNKNLPEANTIIVVAVPSQLLVSGSHGRESPIPRTSHQIILQKQHMNLVLRKL